MATPFVAGIAALLKSHDRNLTTEEVENLITKVEGIDEVSSMN